MRTCGARALRRADWSRVMAFGSHLCHRDGPLPRCTAVLRRASRAAADYNVQPAFACAHTRTRQHAHSLGRRRSTRTCSARALRRAGCNWLVPYESPLRHRDSPIPRCTVVLRRACRGLQQAAGARVCAHANASRCALSREEAQHVSLQCACAAPRWFESAHAIREPTAPVRRPSPSVQGNAPTCEPRSPTSS